MKRGITCLLLLALLLGVLGSGCGMVRDIVVDEAKDFLEDSNGDISEGLEEADLIDPLKGGEETTQESDEKGETVEADDPGDLAEGDFHVFNSLIDFGNVFEEIEIKTTDRDQEETFSYIFLGEDTVAGELTQHLKVTAPDESIEIWVTEESEVIKALVDGEEIDFPQIYGLILMNLMLFTVEPDLSWTQWDFSSQSTVSRDLGMGPVNATSYEVRYPYEEETALTYEVASVAGRNMLIRMEIIQGNDIADYRISRLVPR